MAMKKKLIYGLIVGSLVLIMVSGCGGDEKKSINTPVAPINNSSASAAPGSNAVQSNKKSSLVGEWECKFDDGKTGGFTITITSITEGHLVASYSGVTRNYAGGGAQIYQGVMNGNLSASPTTEVTWKSEHSRPPGTSKVTSGRATITQLDDKRITWNVIEDNSKTYSFIKDVILTKK